MAAPIEFPVLAGLVTATADGQTLPLSSTDIFALFLDTEAVIVSNDGTVKCGGSATPAMSARSFPPLAQRIPNQPQALYYNLKHVYAKFLRSGDSLAFEATLPLQQPSAT